MATKAVPRVLQNGDSCLNPTGLPRSSAACEHMETWFSALGGGGVYCISGEASSTGRKYRWGAWPLNVGAESSSPGRLPYSGWRSASGTGGDDSDIGVGSCRQPVTLGSESWESGKWLILLKTQRQEGGTSVRWAGYSCSSVVKVCSWLPSPYPLSSLPRECCFSTLTKPQPPF